MNKYKALFSLAVMVVICVLEAMADVPAMIVFPMNALMGVGFGIWARDS